MGKKSNRRKQSSNPRKLNKIKKNKQTSYKLINNSNRMHNKALPSISNIRNSRLKFNKKIS